MWLPQNYEAPAGAGCHETGRMKRGAQLTLVREWTCPGLGTEPIDWSQVVLPKEAITGVRRMEGAGVASTSWTSTALVLGGIALGGLGIGLLVQKLRKK